MPRVPARRLSRCLCTEHLEPRCLLSVTPELLLDVNPGQAGSGANSFVENNDEIYFAADDGVFGVELWKSNGSAIGTGLVKDIYTGSIGSGPEYLTSVNDTLFFSAMDGDEAHGTIYGRELWKSDGTEDGTEMVKDIRPGGGTCDPFVPCPGNLVLSSSPRQLTDVNGHLIFHASVPEENQSGLWKSDGKEEDTILLKQTDSNVSIRQKLDDTLFFALGPTIWQTDGNAGSTVEFWTSSSDIIRLWRGEEALYFSFIEETGADLWMTDGTSHGTAQIHLVNADGKKMNVLNNVWETDRSQLFIHARLAVGSYGRSELIVMDLKSQQAVPIAELPGDMYKTIPGSARSQGPADFTVAGNRLFFTVYDAANSGLELWTSDGTSDGTRIVRDIRPGLQGSGPSGLIAVGDTLFFSADDGEAGRELWQSDGTSEGTFMVADTRPGPEGSDPQGITFVNGRILFSADDGTYGREPWQIVLTPGDANLDGEFNQLDIVQVQQAAKYLTGETATWSEGDWNGDGIFNQLDIVAALATGNYLQGPDAAVMTKSAVDPAVADGLFADPA